VDLPGRAETAGPGPWFSAGVARISRREDRAAAFVRANTHLMAPPLVPEVMLHVAGEPIALWELTERDAGRAGLPPPFWAFPWAGGQALARYLLDHPGQVAGREVLDLAAGSGLVAIAAAMAGAARVAASETDPLAVGAIGLNADVNGVSLAPTLGDILDGDARGADVVLAGDVFYERPMAQRLLPFLLRARAAGALVLVGDPGRAYLPRHRLAMVAAYDVPVPAGLEDAGVKRTTVWRLAAGAAYRGT
jgi:predicted nicotinamide N-methyase